MNEYQSIHEKELVRRKDLPKEEIARLAREDNEKAYQKKIDALNKIPDFIKNRNKMAAELQAMVMELSLKLNVFLKQDVKTYQHLFNPDCLFNDSPISNEKTIHCLTQFMVKCDMDFMGHALDGKPSIPKFVDAIEEGSRWCAKWSKAPPKDKTGIDAIL